MNEEIETFYDEACMVLEAAPDFSDVTECMAYLDRNPFPKDCDVDSLNELIKWSSNVIDSSNVDEFSRIIVWAAWDRHCISRGMRGSLVWEYDTFKLSIRP